MSRLAIHEIPPYAQHTFKYKDLTYSFEQALASVYRQKIIIKTYIPYRNGSVKEIVGADDYQITFVGTITGSNGRYPQSEVDQLIEILDIRDKEMPIDVISPWLNAFDIFAIQITDYTFPQVAGGISKQDFTINAISDRVIQLRME